MPIHPIDRSPIRTLLGRAARAARRLLHVHGDQRGTISILSVFAVMLLTMLLGMVLNVGRQVDGKIRMQNAADAAAYSGGVVLSRAMNTLTFTNHLLCDIFSVTAILREGRDRNAESFTPTILDAWAKLGPVFESAPFPKFSALGGAIVQKVPLERQMVKSYSDWAAATSDIVLPLFEEILSNELIPQYQRAVVEAFPDMAQTAAAQSAIQNAQPDHGRGPMIGVLWRTSGQMVGQAEESTDRTLPVVDPENDTGTGQAGYMATAREQRDSRAKTYLRHWNAVLLSAFNSQAKMSQFAGLWRSFTGGQLNKLLNEEYPTSNLPFVIQMNPTDAPNTNQYLDKYYTFVSVVYWKKLPEMLPALFRNPLDADSQAYAAVQMMIPRQRLVWIHVVPTSGSTEDPIGGEPGDIVDLPEDGSTSTSTTSTTSAGYWIIGRQGVPTDWSLMNQSWNCQLMPATQSNLATILQTAPSTAAFDSANLKLPNMGGLESSDIEKISPH